MPDRRGAPRRAPSGLTGRGAIEILLLLTALGVTPLPVQAQQATPPAKADTDPKRDITVTGQRPTQDCSGQTAAQPVDYTCLNKELKAAATSAQPAPSAVDAVTAQATTPSKVGTFSHTATAQRMGQNFGKSAQPYRPPATQYTNPVRGAGPR